LTGYSRALYSRGMTTTGTTLHVRAALDMDTFAEDNVLPEALAAEIVVNGKSIVSVMLDPDYRDRLVIGYWRDGETWTVLTEVDIPTPVQA
jgi:formate dehydrogenase assembly factor FdhD